MEGNTKRKWLVVVLIVNDSLPIVPALVVVILKSATTRTLSGTRSL